MPNKTEMTDYEQYEAMQAEQATAQNTPAKGPTEYEQYEAMLESPEEQSAANWAAIEGKDYVRSASKAVKPVYQAAIDKIDSLFDAGKVSNPTSAKKLRVQDKAAYLGLKPDDIKDSPEADVDQLVARKRAKEFANTYPDFVNKADQKSFEQIFTNPEAVKQINNSAKVRAMKATNLDKFMATNKAGLLSIQNTLSFLGPNGDFDEWAMTNQLVAAERKANNITTAGTSKLNAMWAGETSFVDIAKYVLTDSEGFMAAYAEASNSASSIALSIAGKVAGAGAGAVVGSMGGPIGTVGGGLTGAFLAGGAAALDEYLQNEIATNYTDVNGNVNYAALKADIDRIKTKLRIEGLEHGVIGGAAEMFAPKIFAGLGKVVTKVTPNIPAKVFKSATVKVLAKGGKFSGKVAAKGAEEFIGEGLSDFGPKTLIDFQNGRLNKNKLYTNYRDGLREGVAGAFTAGTIGTVSASVKAGAAALKEDSLKAPKSEPQDQAKPEAKPEPSYNTESKPMNERTPEEAAASAYKTNLAEDTLELTAALDDDTEAAERLEGMTDQEKVALIDSANTPSFTTEEGVVIEGNPEEIIVNGADLETLLGDDVAVVQSVLAQERQVELAQAVQVGEFFRFTYGEWVVSASKLIDKHPTINSLAVNTETEMTGYEAASHLSDQVDQMQIQFERLQTPAVESTPPAIPGISAEIAADANPAAISARKQTGVVKAVTPTGNINQVSLQLIDGSTHLIDLYDKESSQDIQGIADILTKQFEKALKASGRTTDTVRQASLQGIPVIMRVLVKRAKALGKPISEMAKSITFKSDASSGSAYIGTNSADPSKVVYGVGRTAQRVSTVAHEFAHAILHFMTVDGPELEAQKQAGTITPEGLEYLSAIEATAKLLGLKDISDVNDSAATTLTNPKTGKIISRNQSRQPLTKRTVTHEKLATTMEVFLKAGHLKTEAMDTEIAKILLYWRSLIPSEVLGRQASVAAQEGWTYSGEYHQALDPSDEVGRVFDSMYSVAQQIDKTAVPMFNFSFFPVEILGKGGQMILDKVIQAKHTAIAKVFAKVYADSINARTLINTPKAIAKMNKELVEAYGATYSGELVNSISGMGLKIPESLSKDLSNIQALLERYNPDQVPFVRDATSEDIEILMTNNPDAFDVGDTTSDVMARMVETFNGAKADIYQSTLNDLGYVNDDKVKQASEEMLATALPGILNDQFTQLVAAFPNEAKQLFAAYIKNGKVSSRLANKHVSIAAQEKIDNMTWKDLRIQALIKDVRDASTNVVNFFNQGKYIDALIAKYDELTKSEMLRLAPATVKKLLRSVEAIESFGTLKYVQDNAGKVHPETMQYLRDTLNAVAAGTPVQYINIDRLDPALNAFVDGITRRMVNEIAGKKLGTVATQIAIGDYARLMARVATAASTLEQEARDFMEQTKVNQAKVAVLKSTKVWDMTSWLPQANAIHEVFSTYFNSEAAYRDSAIGDIIYKIINGEAKAANDTGEISTRLHEFTKKSLSRKLEPMTLPLTGIKITSRDDLISLMAYAGSESGRDTLLLTHNAVNVDPITNTITTKDSELQKDLDNMVADGTINADDIALVNAIWAEFAPMLKMIQEVYRRDRGIQVGEVKAMPFKVGGMDLTGGYFPISYNEIIKVGESAKAEAAFYNVFNMSTFRRIKNRGEAKNTPVKFGLTPIGAYVNMTVREYYIIPEMKMLEAFVNDPEIKAHIETTRPGALLPPKKSGNTMREVGIINDWVASVKNQVRADIDPNTDKVINFLLKNNAYVFYAFDVISAVTNTVAGIPAAIPYATSKTRLALNVLTWPLNISKHRKQMELSSVMKANSRNFVQYVLAENTEELYSASTTRKDFIERTAMWCQKVSQYVLESIVWNTEYEAALANGKKPDAAIKQADMVTERALGRYALSNKSLGQKAGTIGRLVNMASTHLVTFKRQYNVEIHRDGPLDRKMFMSAMIIGSAISSSMLTLSLFDKFTPDRPEEDEEAKKLRMKWQVATEMIPYFIGPYGRIISAFVNIGFGSDIAITPMEHSIKKAIEGGKRLRVGLGTDYDMGVDDYAAVANTLTMFTGIPFSGFANANDFVTAFRNHDDAAMKKLEDDAERTSFNTEFTEEFNEEYNPLID